MSTREHICGSGDGVCASCYSQRMNGGVMAHRRVHKREVQVVVTPDLNRVVRYHRDLVGNDLTAVLQWCEKHHQPVWVYNDGSWTCPHTVIVQHDTGDHVIVAGPWEVPQSYEDEQ